MIYLTDNSITMVPNMKETGKLHTFLVIASFPGQWNFAGIFPEHLQFIRKCVSYGFNFPKEIAKWLPQQKCQKLFNDWKIECHDFSSDFQQLFSWISTSILTWPYGHIHGIHFAWNYFLWFAIFLSTMWDNQTMEAGCTVLGIIANSLTLKTRVNALLKRYIFSNTLWTPEHLCIHFWHMMCYR